MYKTLKSRALENLKGRWGHAILVILLMAGLIMAASFLTFGIGLYILAGPILYGYNYWFYQLSEPKDEKDPKISLVFEGFNHFAQSLCVYLLNILYIFLWTFLFIIPGIIKSYAYSMAMYIAIDNPEMGANDCITLSRKMMNGHKMEYFILQLTFIGWGLLCILTFGIGFLWLSPYMEATKVNFYKDLREVTVFE